VAYLYERKEFTKESMKNTLAENLLRFGVKNLSESSRKKLIEQATQEPTGSAATSAPTAAPTDPPAPPPAPTDPAAPPPAPTTTDPRVAIIQQWGNQLITKTGKLVASPQLSAEKNEYERRLKLDGQGTVEFELKFDPPLLSTYKTNVTYAKYKYNFNNDTWLASSGDMKSGNIQPYIWAQGNEWSQSDYDVQNIIKNMEIGVNNKFIRTLKSQLGQPTPITPK
jgi:hypothetical protein